MEKVYEEPGEFWASLLARIDQDVIINQIREQIKEIDEEIELLLEEDEKEYEKAGVPKQFSRFYVIFKLNCLEGPWLMKGPYRRDPNPNSICPRFFVHYRKNATKLLSLLRKRDELLLEFVRRKGG